MQAVCCMLGIQQTAGGINAGGAAGTSLSSGVLVFVSGAQELRPSRQGGGQEQASVGSTMPVVFTKLSSRMGSDTCPAVRAASHRRTAWRARALTRCGRASSASASRASARSPGVLIGFLSTGFCLQPCCQAGEAAGVAGVCRVLLGGAQCVGARKRVCLLQYATAAHTLLVQARPIILCQRIVYKATVSSPSMLQATTCLQPDMTGKSMLLPPKNISKACPLDCLLVQ